MRDLGSRDDRDTESLSDYVLFAALRPVAWLATELSVSLRDVKQLTEVATFRELQRRRLKMDAIAERLSVSLSKVSLLSRSLKDRFARADADHALPRRIISLLWASPMSVAALGQSLSDVATADLESCIDDMLAAGRVERVEGRTVRFKLANNEYRLVDSPWLARIDALNNLMSSVADTIKARFFAGDDTAFARTLSFRIRPEDVDELRALYEQHVLEKARELDERAFNEPENSVPLRLSLLWSPSSADEENP